MRSDEEGGFPPDLPDLRRRAAEGDRDALLDLCDALEEAGLHEEAERVLRQAIGRGDSRGHNELGILLDNMGRLFARWLYRSGRLLSWRTPGQGRVQRSVARSWPARRG